MRDGRDLWWHDVVAGKDATIATAEMQAEDPAILLYTSGTTGEPKGCVWTHIGFIGSMVTRDIIICGDFKSSDRFFFFSDMGWMVGAMCACIPSFAGASLLIAEGTPDYPDTGTILAPDRRSSRDLSRRIADDRAQPDALRARGRRLRSLQPAHHGLRRRSLDRHALAVVLRARLQEQDSDHQYFGRHRSRRLHLHRHAQSPDEPGFVLAARARRRRRHRRRGGTARARRDGRRTGAAPCLDRSDQEPVEGRCALYRELLEHAAGPVGAWRLRHARPGRALLHSRPLRRHHQDFRQAHRAGRTRRHC